MTAHLTLYPDVPSDRRSLIVRDLPTITLVLLFVWLGVRVYDLVADLTVLGSGVREAGTTVKGGFDSVAGAGAVSILPVVGGPMPDALHERRRLLAMRAVFGLPFRELLRYTRDPFCDLAAGRYDALVAAALADVGIVARPTSAPTTA